MAVSMTPEHVKPVTFLREIDAFFREASGGPGHRVRFSVSRRLQSALFREASGEPGRRMRFPVTPASQSALLREASGAECAFA